MWDEVVEKAVNVEAKANLQQPSRTRKIDSRCPKRYSALVKKDKYNTCREDRNPVSKRDKDKAKSHNSSSVNQPQIQVPKKDKCSCRGGHSATGVNLTKVAKMDKDKAKDLSYVKCYTCK